LSEGNIIRCDKDQGMVGLIPSTGGHIKRVEIGPPTGMIVNTYSIFVMSRGISVSKYDPPSDLSHLMMNLEFIKLNGVGVAFLKTAENFLEFTLGANENFHAGVKHVIAYSAGIKLNPSPASIGTELALFTGPGNLILGSG